jgi:hypothetical protein
VGPARRWQRRMAYHSAGREVRVERTPQTGSWLEKGAIKKKNPVAQRESADNNERVRSLKSRRSSAMSPRMNWDRVNRENRAARSASASSAIELPPSDVGDATRWNRLGPDGRTNDYLASRAPRQNRRRAVRSGFNDARGKRSGRSKPRTPGSRSEGSQVWADHRGVRLDGREFSWTIACGCGKRLGKRGIRELQALFNCYRSHIGSANRKALQGHRPEITDGPKGRILRCSCEQMVADFTTRSGTALKWLEHAAELATRSWREPTSRTN